MAERDDVTWPNFFASLYKVTQTKKFLYRTVDMYKKKNVHVSGHTPGSVAVVCGVYCRAHVKDTKYRNLKN